MKFLAALFTVLGKFTSVALHLAKCFPKSVHRLMSYNRQRQISFLKYVVCKRCHTIYHFEDCIDGYGVHQKGKTCSFQEFPNHPQQRMRKMCGHILLKSIELSSGRKMLYPCMTYCYLGLEVSLKALFLRPNFYNLVEEHRSRVNVPEGTLSDIYDGKVWSDYQYYNGKGLLSDALSLGLMINVDWFQPYKHINYSVGAIYVVILNLPRHLR